MRFTALLLVGLWLGLGQYAHAHEPPAPSSSAAAVAFHAPPATIASAHPVCAGLFQDIVGNRSRIIQASFICIVIGIFILWKK